MKVSSTFSALVATIAGLGFVGCSDTNDPMAPELPSFAAQSSSNGKTTFSGRAVVVQATVPTLGIDQRISDTGPLPGSGGALETSLLEVSIPGLLSARVAHASTVGQGDASQAEASVADLGLTVAGNTIGASFLAARARAVCTNGKESVEGSSELVSLVVNGQTIVVTGEPNQTVALPVGTIIINEQSSTANSITVNALHVIIPGVADVIIASAHADIKCGGCPPEQGDFVTGGGFITEPKKNFGVAGGLKNGALWGHLVFHDKGSDLKVKGTGVTGYLVLSPTARRIQGTAEVNGQAGFTYTVDVADEGEPGRNDTFSITLSNGYSASGTLAGGNIQLHGKPRPCP